MAAVINHVAIVVPAQNEAATIVETLDALDAARRRLSDDVTSSCIVVLDTCDDESSASIIERNSALRCRVVTVRERCVGLARAAGVCRAVTASHCAPSRIWIANTDADTAVPPDWLIQQIDLAERGVDAVAGIVELLASPIAERFRHVYRFDADGHTHVHGANLGVRASTYLAAGGWGPLPTGEDHDLWNRIGAIGANRVSSATLTVRTSSRTSGRAPSGFAADLAALESSVGVA